MATFREAIYKILQDDAKLTGAGQLGTLLGHSATAPYGVFFHHPPAEPSLPLITYFINAQSGRMPRDIFINVTAWGNNYEAVLNRVHTLLHDTRLTITDFVPLMLKWEGAGAELWDDDLKCYYRQDRYWARVIKE